MKKITLTITALLLIISFSACHINDPNYYIDDTPPAPPSGIYVLNGDNVVDLSWNPNQ